MSTHGPKLDGAGRPISPAFVGAYGKLEKVGRPSDASFVTGLPSKLTAPTTMMPSFGFAELGKLEGSGRNASAYRFAYGLVGAAYGCV